MSEVFDISGFKKFIFLEPDRFRIDGLSIWYNSIPIPVDLFDLFFESWRDYFESYLNHLMVALVLEQICASNKDLSFSASSFPDARLINEHRNLIHNKIEELLRDRPVFSSVAKRLAAIIGIGEYEISIEALLEAASFDGKKYKRLYVPNALKKIAKENIENSLEGFAVSNGDMIGNIIADKLKLYRSGFGDALAGLFNKLLDYKVDKCSGLIGMRSQTVLNVSGSKEHGFIVPVIVQRTTDSALWEPVFDGEVKIRVNPKHPFYNLITRNSDNSDVIKLLSVMTVLEANCPNQNELKVLENIRASISRALWMSD